MSENRFGASEPLAVANEHAAVEPIVPEDDLVENEFPDEERPVELDDPEDPDKSITLDELP